MASRPLTSRPLDLLYFSYFVMHAVATVLVDLQVIYPPHLVPRFMSAITEFYIANFKDPLMGGAMGFFGQTVRDQYVWFWACIMIEAFFLFPAFLVGMYGLWKDSRSVYVLLLAYAASATTSTFACLVVLLATPFTSPETLAENVLSVSPTQLLLLLSSYVPFFVIPLIMAFDMFFRVMTLVRAGIVKEDIAKRK